MPLTQRERLLRAAKKEPVDRPPCICPGGMMDMMFTEIMRQSGFMWPEAHSDAKKMAGLALALNRSGGFENCGVPFCMTVEAEAMGARVNMGSESCEPHVTHGAIASSADAGTLKHIDLQKGRAAAVIEAIKLLKREAPDVPVIGNITGPISLAGTLLDMSVLLREMRKRPDDVEKYLDFVCGELASFAKAQAAAGADAICIAEPSGTGEILGPKLFERHTIKRLNMILDAADVPVKIVHICGSLASVYDLLPQLHCGVFSFDAVAPVGEVKKHLGHIAAMGNVSTFALGSMPPEKAAELARVAVRGGADIVAPACGLPTCTPLASVRAMVSAAAEI